MASDVRALRPGHRHCVGADLWNRLGDGEASGDQILMLDLEHGDAADGVGPDDSALMRRAVVERDIDRVARPDSVVAREHEAVAADHHCDADVTPCGS